MTLDAHLLFFVVWLLLLSFAAISVLLVDLV